MDITFGKKRKRRSTDYKPVFFPTLVRLDERTGDGRLIEAAGFGVRDLPLSLLAQFRNEMGHYGADVVGTLDALQVSGTNVAGWGWTVDTPEGRKAADGLANGSLRGNSVDLADAKVKIKIDWGEDDIDEEWFSPLDILINFTQARIAATTLVTTPAFAEAHAMIQEDEEDEELVASLYVTGLNILQPEEDLTAAVMVKVPHEAFFIAETDTLCPWTVTDDGMVFGHLGDRTSCHTGILDRCVRIPYSACNYGYFNASPIPTTEGRVMTGPVTLLKGHKGSAEAINDAFDSIENVWADVRVIDGQLGPWASGFVRPGTDPEKVFAGAASRISGHWQREEGNLELKVIASVVARGYDFPVVEAGFDDQGIYSLTASMIPCTDVMAAFPSHSTGTASGSWDAGAVKRRVRSPESRSYYGRIFARINPDAEVDEDGKYSKSDMSFPHHNVASGGEPGPANLTACSAGIAILNGGRGGANVSGAERRAIYNHLAKHLRDGGKEPPELMAEESEVMSTLTEIDVALALEDEDA